MVCVSTAMRSLGSADSGFGKSAYARSYGAAIAIDGGGGDQSICAGVAPTRAFDCPYVRGVGAVGIATDEVVGDASRSSHPDVGDAPAANERCRIVAPQELTA